MSRPAERGGGGSAGRELWRFFTSARFTVGLLVSLALLCGLLVLLPQESVVGREAFARLVAESRWRRYLLVDLGLGDLTTSRLFLFALTLFFVNLAAVLARRVRPTLARVALRPLSEKGLIAWARLEESLVAALPVGLEAGRVARVLRDFGYQTRRVGERTFWGVRHRTAPLGFLVFHLSFFLLFAGGVAIYLTRFLGSVTLSEGEAFSGLYATYDRLPPLGKFSPLRFTVLEVEPHMQAGETVHLEARLKFEGDTPGRVRHTRVNSPAQWGSARVLVMRAGLAPVVWIQDAAGFTLDRITVPVVPRDGRAPTELAVAGEKLLLSAHPLTAGAEFLDRSARNQAPLRFELRAKSDPDSRLLDVELRAGQSADFAGGRLTLVEMRHWAQFRVVDERGGGLLIAGFVLGIVGVVWRLLFYRREVAVTWDELELRLVGRSEHFSHAFRGQLAELQYALLADDTETSQVPDRGRG